MDDGLEGLDAVDMLMAEGPYSWNVASTIVAAASAFYCDEDLNNQMRASRMTLATCKLALALAVVAMATVGMPVVAATSEPVTTTAEVLSGAL